MIVGIGVAIGRIWESHSGTAAQRALDKSVSRMEAAINELNLAEAQELCRREGVRYDGKELSDITILARYSDVPIGLAWQFRKAENGSRLYSWGQVVRDQSVRSLWSPSKQQAAQAIRTLRIAAFWFAVEHGQECRAFLARWRLAKYKKAFMWEPDMPGIDALLQDRTIRPLLVNYIVEKVWRSRAGRADMKTSIQEGWSKWESERGSQ